MGTEEREKLEAMREQMRSSAREMFQQLESVRANNDSLASEQTALRELGLEIGRLNREGSEAFIAAFDEQTDLLERIAAKWP